MRMEILIPRQLSTNHRFPVPLHSRTVHTGNPGIAVGQQMIHALAQTLERVHQHTADIWVIRNARHHNNGLFDSFDQFSMSIAGERWRDHRLLNILYVQAADDAQLLTNQGFCTEQHQVRAEALDHLHFGHGHVHMFSISITTAILRKYLRILRSTETCRSSLYNGDADIPC